MNSAVSHGSDNALFAYVDPFRPAKLVQGILRRFKSRTDAGTAVQQTIKLGDAANCSLKTHTVSKEIVETILTDFPGVRYHPKFRLMTWQLMGIAVAACSLQFFTADPDDVEGVSLRRPASTVIKFDPATRQTTSSKRGYPNPMATFLGG